jgi:dihydroorotate dehydrogenase (NAD+) catalytic subunit
MNVSQQVSAQDIDLTVQIGPTTFRNPVLVASGTFGYAREMDSLVNLPTLGGILPKTITSEPRVGNAPWRTVETASGLLNSIGLDNDGIDAFIEHHLPYLGSLDVAVVVSVAGRTVQDFVDLVVRLEQAVAQGAGNIAAVELNISCPNVSGGVDFGTDPAACASVVGAVRAATRLPIWAKLTPNVSGIANIAKAAEDGGADAVSAVNTLLGMSVDWRNKRPLLGNVVGGLSGPAIKPVALRCVHQVASAVSIPVVGIGGISNIDDAMEFLVAGASAVQIGTANYFDPKCSEKIVAALPGALRELGAKSVAEVVGTMKF